MITTSKPSHLRIGNSIWYGTTIYTDMPIKKGYVIAMTISQNYDKVEGHFMSPYGNIFNSTDDFNGINATVMETNEIVRIVALRDIEQGEEILLSY